MKLGLGLDHCPLGVLAFPRWRASSCEVAALTRSSRSMAGPYQDFSGSLAGFGMGLRVQLQAPRQRHSWLDQSVRPIDASSTAEMQTGVGARGLWRGHVCVAWGAGCRFSPSSTVSLPL